MARLPQIASLLLVLSVACEPQRPDDLPASVPSELRRVSSELERARKAPPRPTLPFALAARDGGIAKSESFPCSDCHEPDGDLDTTPRPLDEDHPDVKLAHGGERIWCLDCHHPRQRDALVGDRGVPVPIDQPHRSCGRCHGAVVGDFERGVHGRRVSGWQGERVLLSCLACHEAHAPAIRPRQPAAGPAPRADLPQPKPLEHPSTRLQRTLGQVDGHGPSAAGRHGEGEGDGH